MPELERQRITSSGLVVALELKLGAESYSLSTAQIYNHFRLSVILAKESMNHLLDSMDSHTVAAVDERVTSNVCGSEWLVKVRLVAEVQLGDTSLGNDAAVVRLYAR